MSLNAYNRCIEFGTLDRLSQILTFDQLVYWDRDVAPLIPASEHLWFRWFKETIGVGWTPGQFGLDHARETVVVPAVMYIGQRFWREPTSSYRYKWTCLARFAKDELIWQVMPILNGAPSAFLISNKLIIEDYD